MRLLRVLVVCGLMAAAACTHGGSGTASPTPSVPATASPSMRAVCQSVARVDSTIPPILRRLAAGTETDHRFDTDEDRIVQLSSDLYESIGPYATADADLFTLLNDVVANLDNVVYREDEVTSPKDVDPKSIPPALASVDRVKSALANGTLDCPAA